MWIKSPNCLELVRLWHPLLGYVVRLKGVGTGKRKLGNTWLFRPGQQARQKPFLGTFRHCVLDFHQGDTKIIFQSLHFSRLIQVKHIYCNCGVGWINSSRVHILKYFALFFWFFVLIFHFSPNVLFIIHEKVFKFQPNLTPHVSS